MINKKLVRSAAVSAAALFLMAGSAYAATTISSNISTDGNLHAGGTTILDGDVGIGTASPTAVVNVESTEAGPGLRLLQLHKSDLAPGDDVYLKLGKSQSLRNEADIDYFHDADGSVLNRLNFGFNGVSTLMTVRADGNVGIGDTSPVAMLTVGSGDLFQVSSSGLVSAPDGDATNTAYGFTADDTMGLFRGPSDNNGAIESVHVAGGAGQTIDLEGYVELPIGELEADQGATILSGSTNGFAITANGSQSWTHCFDTSCSSDVTAPTVFAGQADAYFDNTAHRLLLSNDGGSFSKILTAGDHYASTGPASSSGGGTDCTAVTVSGTDTRGTIIATCNGIAQKVQVSFGSGYGTAPICVVSPTNSAAANGKATIASTTAAFTVTPVSAVSAGTWNYVCIE